jgi:hypothetical protein
MLLLDEGEVVVDHEDERDGRQAGDERPPNEEEDDVDDVRVGVKLKQRDVLPSPEFGAKFRNFITKEQLVSVPNCFSRLAK